MKHRLHETGSPRQLPLLGLIVACAMLALAAAGCQKSDPPGEPADREATQPDQPQPEPVDSVAARAVLDRMVAAYQNAASYSDRGELEVAGMVGADPIRESAPYLTAFQRPNKFRLMLYRGLAVSDGEHFWGLIAGDQRQVLKRPAPKNMGIGSVFPDKILADVLAEGPTYTFSWVPIPLLLARADDPLKTLLYHSEDPKLLEPAKIDDFVCDRVEVVREDGTAVFWIDQALHVLRRFEFPADSFRAMIAQARQIPLEQVHGFSLVADFHDAQIDGESSALIYDFLEPAGVKMVEHLMPSVHPLLGNQLPGFQFVDLEGNPITSDELAGKVAVLDVWATWCEPCRITLPELEQVYQQYLEDPRVAFLAVSVDRPETDNRALASTFEELGVHLPIARDEQGRSLQDFMIDGVPSQFLVDSTGKVVGFEAGGGGPPGAYAARLSEKLKRLLAGQDILEEQNEQFRQQQAAIQAQFEQFVEMAIAKDLFLTPGLMEREAMTAEILPRTEPHTLKLTQRWSCTGLSMPGDLLAVKGADGSTRLLALIDDGRAIAEIGPDGEVISTTPLDLPGEEPIRSLRTGVGADGKRYFLGLAIGVQQLHLFDDQFNRVISFPKDVVANPHAGIADARLRDLDGDGQLDLAVGYFGVVGVQCVTLDGTRVWTNRSLAQVVRLAELEADGQGRRNLLSMNNPSGSHGTLVLLEPEKGERIHEIALSDRSIVWISAADLDRDGRSELCGLSPSDGGNLVALGLSLDGEELWNYPLPLGAHEREINVVSSGNLLGEGPDQWILIGADGTIHILAHDGTPVDLFAYGWALTGLTVADWDGRTMLFVATAEGVDAWEVGSGQ